MEQTVHPMPSNKLGEVVIGRFTGESLEVLAMSLISTFNTYTEDATHFDPAIEEQREDWEFLVGSATKTLKVLRGLEELCGHTWLTFSEEVMGTGS